ncbi:metalloregulator ArsR/SmtB family transcription factor [Novipirellula rosea]|uniref:Metalloregulator ArsR/SmtB family transcription factor n=1 Tax=Novipirellula rosea TaxID=1031540 RepID=A0ABP8N1G4_9BACT
MAKKKAVSTSAKAVDRASAKPEVRPTASGATAFTEAAECLKTIAHPVRLRMIQLLLTGRYTVGELAADCQIPDNVASEHLRLMQRCGFFTSEREGRRVYYQVAEPHLKQLMACIESRFLPQ